MDTPNTGAQTPDRSFRSYTLQNGTHVEHDGDEALVDFPDGTRVEVPAGYADATFVSNAGKLCLHRRYPSYTLQAGGGGAPVSQEKRPDPFQFEGGVYPAAGQKLTAADYAELVTNPFYGTKYELVRSVEEVLGDTRPAIQAPAALSDEDLVAQMQARADAGSPVAVAFLQAQGSYRAPAEDGPVVVGTEQADAGTLDGFDAAEDNSGDDLADTANDVRPGNPGTPAATDGYAAAVPSAGDLAMADAGGHDLATGVGKITTANVDEAAEALLAYAREQGDGLTPADLMKANKRGLSVERVRSHANRLGIAFTSLTDGAD